MDSAGRAQRHRRGVLPDGRQVRARGLHAEHLHLLVVQERREETDGVASAAHARHEVVRQLTRELLELLLRLATDDALEVPDHHRERVRAHDGADGVELRNGVAHVRAERGVHGFLEGF